ncbi:MAG: hypothetical protein ABI051_07790 [Vicinamibacterales bacterium]
MSRRPLGLVMLLSCAIATPLSLGAITPATAPLSRTLYVTVTDKEGKAVPGLTPKDFTVKDGGKEREITSVQLPAGRMKLAILIEEALSPDTAVRQGILDFGRRLLPIADVSIVAAGIKNTMAVDFTTDVNKLVEGLNSLTLLNGRMGSHMAEGIMDLARDFQKSKPERPVIVAVALEIDQESADRPDMVLNELRLSRAMMNVVGVTMPDQAKPSLSNLADQSERSKVIGEGPRQSGGTRVDVVSSRGIPSALMQVAGALEAQYAITYVLPEGTKPSDRISVSTSRKNVNMTAPSRVNDK